jgi:hypothetical protein
MTTHSEHDAVAWNKHREQQRQRYALPRLSDVISMFLVSLGPQLSVF